MPNTAAPPYHLAYVFERFPSFTQTFCAREILELERLGLRPLIFSIHDTREENIRHFPAELFDRVHVLPPPDELVEIVKKRKDQNAFPQGVILTLRHWQDRPDKLRVYEAAYIGSEMQRHGIRHAHSHFAGMGARVCYWMRPFFGHTFSFTGHANDIFCEPDSNCVVSLARLINDAALVVTVSDYSVNRLSQTFPQAADKIHRVYNGLDLAPFQRAIGSSKSTPPEILSVGRLIEKKGFDNLIRAMAIVKTNGTPCICKIVGEGSLLSELQQLIHETQTGDVVELVGPQSQDVIIDLLSKASIFALPCVTEQDGGMDNLPTVIMEAMAAGLPCVSTTLAGVPEMVIDGGTGRLVPERQPDAFADALLQLLSSPTDCQRMGEHGLQRAQQFFAKEVTAAHLADLLIRNGTLPYDAELIQANTTTKAAYAIQYFKRLQRNLNGTSKPVKRPLDKFQL
ncbi:MAG: colanic acid/amylovoran biosynthesis glycosyltransferase [Verrucomicrobiales bacterium]|jgi:colanic acid/amylovoran biosynthesis glycosyltransferase